jgi:heat shock protein HslJ
VAQNFEGEADPARMTLDMKPWTWIRAVYNDGREIAPRQAEAFTLTFRADGTVAVTTDCNRMMGGYTTNGRELTFGNMAATRMFCADSQETEFSELLANTSSYSFMSRGELVLQLKFDSGSVVFR